MRKTTASQQTQLSACREIRGIGFIEYVDEADAADCKRDMDRMIIDGKEVHYCAICSPHLSRASCSTSQLWAASLLHGLLPACDRQLYVCYMGPACDPVALAVQISCVFALQGRKRPEEFRGGGGGGGGGYGGGGGGGRDRYAI